jgi:hypothetical protein
MGQLTVGRTLHYTICSMKRGWKGCPFYTRIAGWMTSLLDEKRMENNQETPWLFIESYILLDEKRMEGFTA